MIGSLTRLEAMTTASPARLIQPKTPFALYQMRDAIRKLVVPVIGFDIETTSLEPWDGGVRLLQFSVGTDVYVIDHRDFISFSGDARQEFLLVLRSILESREIVKVAHNGKFEAKWMLYHFGIEITPMFDTMIASLLIAAGLDYDERGNRIEHSLKASVERFLGKEMDKTEQTSDWNVDVLTREQIAYAAKDALVMVPLYSKQLVSLIKDGLLRVAMIEFDAILPIAQMENNGFHLDVGMWKSLLEHKEIECARVKSELMPMLHAGVDWMMDNPAKKGKRPVKPKKPVDPRKQKALKGTVITEEMVSDFNQAMLVWQKANTEYAIAFAEWDDLPKEIPAELNLNSWQQIQRVFKNLYRLNLESTNDAALSPYADKYPAIEKLLEYRGWTKSIGTYGQNVIDKCDSNNRVHADFKQNGAGTGRMSCGGGVNLQNIPNDPEHRYCWTAPEGKKLVIADYSQIELRILADFSGDENFIAAFKSGEDFHTVTAAQVFHVKPEEVTTDQRTFAKRLNFGVVYGVGARKFALQAGITESEAEEIMRQYFETYRGNDIWLNNAARQAVQEGFTRTPSGRLMRFNTRDATRKQISGIGRNGRNSPIQGGGADMLKRALYLLHVALKGTTAKLVNVVHDEIILETDAWESDLIAESLEEVMRQAGEEFVKRVPIKVDAIVSDKWTK